MDSKSTWRILWIFGALLMVLVGNKGTAMVYGDVVEEDLCPNDPNKNEPGHCGCGVPDIDSDDDGVMDCEDTCPHNPNRHDGECACHYLKPNPDACGCEEWDIDSDGDGILDCFDECPDNPHKTSEGICGCDHEDIDSDEDFTPDCLDACPLDPHKLKPGKCGCGYEDDVYFCDKEWKLHLAEGLFAFIIFSSGIAFGSGCCGKFPNRFMKSKVKDDESDYDDIDSPDNVPRKNGEPVRRRRINSDDLHDLMGTTPIRAAAARTVRDPSPFGLHRRTGSDGGSNNNNKESITATTVSSSSSSSFGNNMELPSTSNEPLVAPGTPLRHPNVSSTTNAASSPIDLLRAGSPVQVYRKQNSEVPSSPLVGGSTSSGARFRSSSAMASVGSNEPANISRTSVSPKKTVYPPLPRPASSSIASLGQRQGSTSSPNTPEVKPMTMGTPLLGRPSLSAGSGNSNNSNSNLSSKSFDLNEADTQDT